MAHWSVRLLAMVKAKNSNPNCHAIPCPNSFSFRCARAALSAFAAHVLTDA
jgi:hypothetical protein